MKKIISAGLATILAASALSTAAFADEFTMTAESILAKPAIKVTLPKSMAFVFNPYELNVDIKGKVVKAADGETEHKTVLVPSYVFNTGEGAINDAWAITNGTGAPLQAAVYAYAENKTGSEFKVLNLGDNTALGEKERALYVKLTVSSDDTEATVGNEGVVALKGEKLDTKTKSIWLETNGATTVSSFNETLKVGFDLTDEGCKTAKGTNKTAWTDKDAAKINFIFAFELSEPVAEEP